MARIRWHGAEYTAVPVSQIDDKTWLMSMTQHGPRFTPGTEVHVKVSEIIEMAAAETPGDFETFLAASDLEADMAEERKTLPTVHELLGKARKDGTIVNPKPVEETPNAAS